MESNDNLLRIVLIVLATILLIPFLMMLFMIPVMGFGHMWYFNGTRGSLWPILLFGFVCLLIIFGIIYLLYRAIVGLQRGRSNAALQELRQAYARGDLTDEEFETRREQLRREEEHG